MSERPLPLAGAAMEGRSQQTDAQQLAAARRRFRGLDLADQMAVARRICDTRQQDYTRLISSALAMHPGLKRRRSPDGGEAIHREACVVFVVRDKWQTDSTADNPQAVPKFLLSTWVTPAGKAVTVAVPTDVQSHARFGRIAAQSASGVDVYSPAARDFGVLTCLLQCGNALYAIAPLHVMTPGGAAPLDKTALRPAPSVPGTGQAALVTTDFGGRLSATAPGCFDLQWARVNKTAALRTALAPQAWSQHVPWVPNPATLHQWVGQNVSMFILLPDNHPGVPVARGPARVALSQDESSFDVEYAVAGGVRAMPHFAIEFQLEQGRSTAKGDSGSAVVALLDDGSISLIGMHIAGSTDDGTSYVVPAWRLMSPSYHLTMQARIPGPKFSLVRL